jgi:hypothetical protein
MMLKSFCEQYQMYISNLHVVNYESLRIRCIFEHIFCNAMMHFSIASLQLYKKCHLVFLIDPCT